MTHYLILIGCGALGAVLWQIACWCFLSLIDEAAARKRARRKEDECP